MAPCRRCRRRPRSRHQKGRCRPFAGPVRRPASWTLRGEQAGGTLALVGRRGLVGVGLLLCLRPRPLRHAHHQVDHLRPDVLVNTVRFLGAAAKLWQPPEIVEEGAHARRYLKNVARLRYGEDGLIVALVEKALEDDVSKHFAGAGGHRLEARCRALGYCRG